MNGTAKPVGKTSGVLLVLTLLLWAAGAAGQALHFNTFSQFNGNAPIGIDYHEPNGGNLIMSANYPSGEPWNLNLINTATGTVQQFSPLHGLTDELKIASTRSSAGCQQYPVGTVFTANGHPGEIVRMDPNGNLFPPALNNPGVAANNSWVKLPGEQFLLRGSFYVDRGCAFGGDLIVVSGIGDDPYGGGVWRVAADGSASKVATIQGKHLEGLITLPNNPIYGPWAGKIVAGAETFNLQLALDGYVYTIAPNGAVQQWDLAFTGADGVRYPVKPEDIDIIKPGADFFGIAYQDDRIFRVPAADFAPYANQILITQEFPCGSPSGDIQSACPGATRPTTGLYVISFVNNQPVVTPLQFAQDSAIQLVRQWEHITFAPRGDVQVTKTTDTPSVGVGGIATYNIVVTANGPDDSFNVILQDNLPSGLAWTVGGNDAGACSINNGILSCMWPVVSAGTSKSITLSATTTSASCPSINNTAIVTSGNDSNSANNTAGPVRISLNCPPQLRVEKLPDNGTFTSGAQVSFSIRVSNTGTGPATNVQLVDSLPGNGGLVWTTASTTQGTCVNPIQSNSLSCSLGTIPANGSVTVTVLSTATTPAAACQQQFNPAAIAVADGGLSAQDSGSLNCLVGGSYTLVKSPKNANYNVGDNISFNIVVTSTGPGTASNVVVNDPLPTLGNLNSWIITSSPGGCTITNNVLNCQFGNLPNGAIRTVTVSTNVSGGADVSACPGGQKLNNTATLSGTGLPTLTDTGDYTCTPPGGYRLVKSPKNATYNIGDNVSFSMTVTSTGPGTASNVVLNDPLPTLGNLNSWVITSGGGASVNVAAASAGATVSASSTYSAGYPAAAVIDGSRTGAPNGAGGFWNDATLSTFPDTVQVNFAAAQSIDHVVVYSVQDNYLNPVEPTDGMTFSLYGLTDFEVQGWNGATWVTLATVNGNNLVKRTVTFSPFTTDRVRINTFHSSDNTWSRIAELEAFTVAAGPSACTITNNVLNCQFGNVPAGQTRTVTVSTNVPGGADASACPGNVKLNNTATLTGTGQPTVTDTGDYVCTPPGAYKLTKSPKNATYNVGDNISFNIVVTSTGPGTANNVVVNDPLPTLGNLNSWIITANPGGCAIANNVLNCQFGSLASGATRTVTLSTNVAGGADLSACPGGQKLNNTATATATGLPTLTDTGDYTCTPPGSFKLVKTPKNATYNIGDNISFTVTVTGTGPGTANNVVVNDPLPALGNLNSWIITSSPGGCTITNNVLNCQFGNLTNGASRMVTVSTNASGGADISACPGGQKLNNTATATATGLPTQTDTGDYTCTPSGSYKLVKSPKNATYNIGDNVSFTMTVTSTGPGPANNVVLNDPLPTLGNLNNWIITANPGGCTIANNVLNCQFGNLASGASRTITLSTNVAGGADLSACPGGQKLNNTATLTGTGLTTLTDTGDYTCTPPGGYRMVKSPKNATYKIGDNVSFSILVTSTGPGSANNVVVNDPLPTLGNLNSWTITSNPGGCTIANNVLNCQLGNLAGGASRTVTVSTNASGGADLSACPGGLKLNNTATATANGLPTLTDTGDYSCTPTGSYTLVKTPKNATYNVGDNVSFAMTVTSTGPAAASNVVLNDPLPTLGNLDSWIITANPGGCTIANNVLNCQFGSLPNGASRTVLVSTDTTGGADLSACPGGQKLNNTATLTGAGLPTLTDTGDYTCTPPGSYTLTKTPKNATYNIGDNISFTMTVTSNGPGSASNVVLNDPLPTLGSLNSWTITSNPGGCTITNNVLNCQFGTLPAGASRNVTIATNASGGADAAACPGGQKLNNTATLTALGLPTVRDTGSYSCTPCPPEDNSFTTTVLPNGDIQVTFNQSRIGSNDNSYGAYDVGWGGPNKHKFSDLVGSDKLQMVFTDKNGNKVLDIYVDYISQAPGQPGGYASLGVTGGEGKVNFGNAAWVKLATTSLTSDMQKFCPTTSGCTVSGVDLLTNSPQTVCTDNTMACYQLPAGSPFAGWDFTNSYTVVIDKAAFGAAGFGSVSFPLVHNSPGKGTAPLCTPNNPQPAACVLGYPFTSSNPLTSVVFNESGVLQAFDPAVAGPNDTVRLFATDEHAILLGVRNGTAQVSSLGSVPGHVSNPMVGDTNVTDPSGRPIFPSLFITDVTGITDTSASNTAYRAGDWQYGGTPIPPSDVFGTWKGATVTGSTLTTDADPAKNNWNLGPGSDTPSVGFASLDALGYGAEVRWNVADLRYQGQPLQPGHTYRLQFMVHDGDQNKTGGDVGQACALVEIPAQQVQ